MFPSFVSRVWHCFDIFLALFQGSFLFHFIGVFLREPRVLLVVEDVVFDPLHIQQRRACVTRPSVAALPVLAVRVRSSFGRSFSAASSCSR